MVDDIKIWASKRASGMGERAHTAALDFIDKVDSIPTVDETWGTFLSFVQRYGFVAGGLADIPGPGERIEDTTLCLSWPEAWRERYFTLNYVADDPAQLHMSRSIDPFTWSEVLDLPCYTRRQRQIVYEASEFALTFGLIVPILGLQTGPALVTIAGSNIELSRRDRAEIHMAAVYAHAHIRALSGTKLKTQTTKPLAPRERECLQWVAAGKSDWEISEILSISEKTANTHIERAKQKFGVVTRKQAVALALRSGQIKT